MLTRRIIACLDMAAARVVKGTQFLDLRDAGDPAELAARHADQGADEIVLLDIAATPEGRSALLEVVRQAAEHLFIPFTVGGGIRTLQDAAAIFDAGADKITLNSAAIADPQLITEIASRFGAQAVVLAIDARRNNRLPGDRDDYDVWVAGGRRLSGRTVLAWAKEAVDRGAGEILLTSMDRDGTGNGFDCQLTERVANSVSVPVIASGGGGKAQHFVDVFGNGGADAALAASIFHFGVITARELKLHLRRAGVPVRLPC